jgi:ABC-type glutathione transport system ATPase component
MSRATIGRGRARRLAPVIVERLLPRVREYAQESGCGVLLVEQHVQLALEVADRGYVLSHGQVVLHRPVEELRADRQLLIASYLGEQVHEVAAAAADGAPASPLPSSEWGNRTDSGLSLTVIERWARAAAVHRGCRR